MVTPRTSLFMLVTVSTCFFENYWFICEDVPLFHVLREVTALIIREFTVVACTQTHHQYTELQKSHLF